MEVFSKHKLSDLKDLQKFNGADMIIGGMMTSGQKRLTKTGKEFGIFVLEDYNDSHEFPLFGKDFIEFGKFLNNFDQPRFVLVRGKIQPRYGMPDQLEFKVTGMELLSELGDKIKTCSLQIPLSAISDDSIAQLQEVVKRHEGKTQLRFSVFDVAENIKVELPSRKTRVKADKAFLEDLQSVMPEVSWKLN
jgi:DNA polymerase-3 subunit alpha